MNAVDDGDIVLVALVFSTPFILVVFAWQVHDLGIELS